MDMHHVYKKAHALLIASKKPVLVSHRKPDGDTIGAACAIANHLIDRGRGFYAYCLDPVPDVYGYLPAAGRFSSDTSMFLDPEVDLIAVFDAGDLRYCGVDAQLPRMAKRPVILNFDHHATNERFGDVNVLDVTAASTTEVIQRFLVAVDPAELSNEIATCILAGLMVDTSGFSNPATTSSSLASASILLKSGARMQEAIKRLFRNKSVEALRLWGVMMERLKYHPGLRIASTAVFARDLERFGVSDEEIEGMSNFLGASLSCDVILVLKELPGGLVKGSLRTIDEIDVSEIAVALGGGGHKKASGFTVAGEISEFEDRWAVVRHASKKE